ncbi:MAG: SGNH/GDSL hydrolase family protein [Rikenellaceae bacterium]
MKKFFLILSAVTLLLLTAFTSAPTKKNVLIIGDSVSQGYTKIATKELADIANIVHNPGNGKDTTNGLKYIDEWLAINKWDIIHLNWGLWDLCYRHPESKTQGKRDKVNGTIAVPIDDYAKNLEALVKKLKSSGAKLIFATTTYVPINEAGRFVEDATKYNKVAKEIMMRYDVTINPLYDHSLTIHPKYGKGDDDVHYTDEGYKALSIPVIEALKRAILEE